MKSAVIVNPRKVGDTAAARGALEQLVAQSPGGFDPPTWIETTAEDTGPGHARRAVDDGADMVLVWGGDGTVNGVAGALAGSGVPVGVLPGGTANLLARNLGIPLDLAGAVATAYDGVTRTIDLLDVDLGNDERRISMVMAGTGWDAAMMAASEKMKRRLGWGAYVVTGAKALTLPSMDLRISLDGAEPIEIAGRTILLANVGSLVAGFDLIPEAMPDDGLMEVLVIGPNSPTDWVRTKHAIAFSRGSENDPSQTLMRAREVVVHTGHVRRRQIDGDLVSNGASLAANVLPSALSVRVPC
jgi:diacylglycerol kinase family enzyme